VVKPAAADIPDVIPKPIARGRATMATVKPAIRSVNKSLRFLANSFLLGQKEKNISECKQTNAPLSVTVITL